MTTRSAKRNVSAELWETEIEINRAAGNASTPVASKVLTAQEIQKLLGANDLLLEYAVTESKICLWAVTSKDVKSFQLSAGSETVEQEAGAFYDCVSQPPQIQTAKICRQTTENLSRTLLLPVAGSLNKSAANHRRAGSITVRTVCRTARPV